MPGSGKTTYGVLASEILNIPFIDTDFYIEQKYRMQISRIFSLVGEKGFRVLEHNGLEEIISKNTDCVIATGGGLPCFHNNIDMINNSGYSIYLKTDINTLASRLVNSNKKRPLTENLTEVQLNKYLNDTLTKRSPYYEKAQIITDASSFKKTIMSLQFVDNFKKKNL